MKCNTYHIQLNVSNPKVSLPFYKELFVYFEYKIIDEGDEWTGFSNGTTDFWFIETESKYKKNKFHRKNTGINHISLRVQSKSDVDKFTKDFLNKRNIKTLYETPKLFPQHREGFTLTQKMTENKEFVKFFNLSLENKILEVA